MAASLCATVGGAAAAVPGKRKGICTSTALSSFIIFLAVALAGMVTPAAAAVYKVHGGLRRVDHHRERQLHRLGLLQDLPCRRHHWIFSSSLLGHPHTSTGQEEQMEDAREERARVALKATTGGAGRRKKGSTGGVMLHHGGCFDSDDQTTSPVTPLPEEERTHVPDLHQNTSPAPKVVSKGQASSASSPEEEYSRRGRRFLAHDGGVLVSGEAAPVAALEPPPPEEDCGRERLKRHRVAMAGRVWIPEIWGQETLLRDWIDCAVIDRALVPSGLLSARKALVGECRRANSGGCLST